MKKKQIKVEEKPKWIPPLSQEVAESYHHKHWCDFSHNCPTSGYFNKEEQNYRCWDRATPDEKIQHLIFFIEKNYDRKI
jgi:hypothetical protein